MIFLVIFGGLMLILGGFYLANSWMHYREWKTGTIIVVLSLAAVIYGGINLPYFHHNQQTRTEQSSSSSQTTQAQSSSAFSNKMGSVDGSANNQATQENKEMAVLRQLQKGYSKLGTVSFDEDSKTFTIKPTDDNTVKAMEALVQDPSQAEQIGWPNLTKSIKANSKQISKILGSDYSLSIVNPDNTKQSLYTAKGGQTTHDIADQSSSSSN
ncbi:DUF308 domain-containing protein [Limosilactobacillus sp.]|jgi:hypothetical protein|uniref:DUF308 domain-containing protein n=1 Tax=Limosilactobacillus sp. TaxID=2773925 RepID=UPI0025BFDC68|nr:DUF308 domain-containing protein [Limosilactobacillus sp.]MCH3922567.1 DUF308 domain-containing protein [Limosilactobacillus sp.]MCH3927249.1 DUF308 domain-containing protein [Limosilactobacillus sp.]